VIFSFDFPFAKNRSNTMTTPIIPIHDETRQPCGRKTPCGGDCHGRCAAPPAVSPRAKRQTVFGLLCVTLIALFCFAGLFSSYARAETKATPQTTATSTPAASTTAASATAAPQTQYGEVDLKRLVPASRMTDGSRAIFQPKPVRFQARLHKGLQPQKADYLQKVMGMMGVAEIPQVSQRVVIDYGGDKPLAVYVEDKIAQRLKTEAKVGESYTFYAFHVYNNRYGPAMVITSFAGK
jgi:hypothetical protein